MIYKKYSCYLLTFFILLTSIEYSFTQKKNNPSSNTEHINRELSDSIQKLNNEIKVLKNRNNIPEINIDAKLNDASKTIEYLNSLSSSFGSLFTILGIFIAIISIIIPILTYFFGIQPYKKTLEDLEKNIDKRLENYIKETRDKSISKSLKNILEGNSESKNLALSFLTFTQPEGFSENQFFQIYSIVKKLNNDYQVKSQLAFILSNAKTDYSKELFNSEEVINDPVIKQMAYMYYGKIGFKENYHGIEKILSASDDQATELKTLIYYIGQYSNSEIALFINDIKIIDNLKDECILEIRSSMSEELSKYIPSSDVKSSYLFTKTISP